MKFVLKIILFGVVAFAFLLLLETSVLDDAEEWNGHYYQVFSTPMNWNEAKVFCESMGGHLVTVEIPAENEMLKELIASANAEDGKFWMGGTRNIDNIWRWVTENPIHDLDLENATPAENATKLYMDINRDGQWLTESETSQFPFVCEWENVEDAHDSDL